jgi:drug/metabolite transporter (DMT)-like permease
LEARTLIGLAVYVVLGVCGDLLLSRGMRQMDGGLRGWSLAEGGRFFRHIFTTPAVVGGVACLALNFAALLALLTWVDVSVVGPSRAATYLLLALSARWFLGERVTPRRWLGVTLISIGVTMTVLSEGG